jgi:hypothetical protein
VNHSGVNSLTQVATRDHPAIVSQQGGSRGIETFSAQPREQVGLFHAGNSEIADGDGDSVVAKISHPDGGPPFSRAA